MTKETLHRLLLMLSGFFSHSLLRKLAGQRLILPFYHVVSDMSLPHIKHLYPYKSPQAFEKDLDFLCKNYTPVSLEQVINHQLPSEPSFLLSFDDGLSECYHIIAPILKARNIPAVFFLNSAFIDNKALMFRYKASLIIEACSKSPDKSKLIDHLLLQHNKKEGNSTESLLQLGWKDNELLDIMAQQIGIDFSLFLNKNKPYLTSNQVKELLKDGFSIGSHSTDHPHFFQLPLTEQISQALESQNFINKNFAPNHKVFAFPFTDFGVSTTFFNTIYANHQVDISFGGAGVKKDAIKKNLQRIPIENPQNKSAEDIIKAQYLYYILKRFINKNTIKRQ